MFMWCLRVPSLTCVTLLCFRLGTSVFTAMFGKFAFICKRIKEKKRSLNSRNLYISSSILTEIFTFDKNSYMYLFSSDG